MRNILCMVGLHKLRAVPKKYKNKQTYMTVCVRNCGKKDEVTPNSVLEQIIFRDDL